MRPSEVLYKPQLPKASHCKRDKEMRKRKYCCSWMYKTYMENFMITLSTKPSIELTSALL